MAVVDISSNPLTPEILEVVRNHAASSILDAVADAALSPRLTDRLFVHFEAIFADICARWILQHTKSNRKGSILAAFARILPFAPYLSIFLEQFLAHSRPEQPGLPILTPTNLQSWSANPDDYISLQNILLAVWRLNSFDQRTYGSLLSPSDAQELFHHGNRAVRYLAIRIFCQLLQASDFKLESLVHEHLGTADPITGDLDGREIDLGFLSLHEHARVNELDSLRTDIARLEVQEIQPVVSQSLTQHVVSYGRVTLPRLGSPTEKNSPLVVTATVQENLEHLAKLLQRPGSILLHGLPGSGKTSVIQELSRDLGMKSDMVTLHLNDQTDAKMLIGLYTTGSKPGSFEWRPGVLTKAVKEGRWVLIEDLDRAPAEVVSSLLPLVERGELLIPSRSEKIKAASGFRLFATVRTSKGMNGQETLPHLLGLRFWQQLSIRPLPELEIEQIIRGAFPILDKLVPQILSVFHHLARTASMPSMATSSRGIVRQMTLRELLKWCRRLQDLLNASGTALTISEVVRERMFMEAVDCFVGHLPESKGRDELVFAIGEEMHMARAWVEHQMTGYVPALKDSDSHFRIGRTAIEKHKNPALQRSKRPFADTTQAKKLLEQLTRSVQLKEPVLLVGETGIGKTTVIQQLADIVGRKVVAVNLSQQSEVGDLLGGFKPVNSLNLAIPLKDEFDDLFRATGLAAKNQPYLNRIAKYITKRQWTKASKMWVEGVDLFRKLLQVEQKRSRENGEPPAKRQKQDAPSRLGHLVDIKTRWEEFSKNLEVFNAQVSGNNSAFAFSFVEGNIVKAARNGDWVLLDEINLASSDTLESITDLLTDPGETPSILLSETGEIERIKAHPNFRIFGAMNPATDVGKRDLPVGIRSRFTEIYVNSPDRDYKDLLKVVKAYLQIKSAKDEHAADDITRLYLNTKRLADEKRLVDGANEVPHFSLRTLTRVLSYRNLLNLVRATSNARDGGFPVLIQGPTSAGKTSMIEYLASYSGNKFVRINNHEHTDLQEYLGTYVSGSDGKLRFQDGLLVQAMRKGYWIVLDELNLAPTDVLEALNRLLDDNRELLIPETQEIVKPHENFRLFATQNPRLHFDDIPEDELEYILQKRNSFATLRDLFRWTLRNAETREEIAANGFMLLAERVRNEAERIAVKEIIEKVFKVKINLDDLYSKSSPALRHLQQNRQGVVWTQGMRRLYLLVAQAIRNHEPVLLVGETGCGKTTVCQVLAEVLGKELHIVNAHQNTETGDIIGSQRPIRNRASILEALHSALQSALELLGQDPQGTTNELLDRIRKLPATSLAAVPDDLKAKIETLEIRSKALFEWSDGNLVHAMKTGQFFLLDEISLADDSVLERLNSDINQIVTQKLDKEVKGVASIIVGFATWFGETFRSASTTAFSIRELLVWVQFVNQCHGIDPVFAIVNGAATVFIDSLGANPSGLIALDSEGVIVQRRNCLNKLSELLGSDISSIYDSNPQLTHDDARISIGGFSVPAFPMMVVRALQMQKPILLEGSPGVGKTTLVAALAQVCGQPLTRINLSDQTDLMDLFGTDVPVDGAEAGNFAWRDAPFLRAMQKGEWVLLDEMNLASQSVLEGLNACLDHRGEVYISELDQVFKRHPDFRLFAAQNPHHQGGGRKGLPSSFVNRFVVVYADVFSSEDLNLIARNSSPDLPLETTEKLIRFITDLEHKITQDRSFGSLGAPWEFNLRDLLRWLHLLQSSDPLLGTARVDDLLDIVIRQRFRTERDRQEVANLFANIFGEPPRTHNLYHDITSSFCQVGLALMKRSQLAQPVRLQNVDLKLRLADLETLMLCVTQDIPCILSGPSGSGKSVLIQHVAALAGKSLVTFPLNADVDTMDLVGGFEQSDPLREVNAVLRELKETLQASTLSVVPQKAPADALQLLYLLETTAEVPDPSILLPVAERLLSVVSESSEVGVVLTRAVAALQKPLIVTNPRFEWLDGVIIKALQTGQWLVLDNANLCSASVLDRLNSLLEPNGFISVNEHCDPNGEPRIVRPHPDFRIFLTTDPRYGELSRAMRNRAIEIHLFEPMPERAQHLRWITPIESTLQRYHFSWSVSDDRSALARSMTSLALERLTKADLNLLPRFAQDAQAHFSTHGEITKQPQQLIEFFRSDSTRKLRSAVSDMYSSLSTIASPDLADIQPIFPVKNFPMTILVSSSVGSQPFRLAMCYEYYQDLQSLDTEIRAQASAAKNTKIASLNRLQRAFVAERVTAVAKDSTVGAADFFSTSISLVDGFLRPNHPDGEWQDQNRLLRGIMHYLRRTLQLVAVPHAAFDEAVFQAHLNQGRAVLKKFQSSDPNTQRFVLNFLANLDKYFSSGFSLKTGLGMEEIWRPFRPCLIPDSDTLRRSGEIVALASRFDTLKWKTGSSLADLAKAASTLATAFGIVRSGRAGADELIGELTREIQSLETRIGLDSADKAPFFAATFETLRQISILQAFKQGVSIKGDEIAVLSNAPVIAQLYLEDTEGYAQLLQTVDHLTCQSAENFAWNGRLLTSVLSRAGGIKSAKLKSLSLLEIELPQLTKFLSRASRAVTSSALTGLNSILHKLIVSFIEALQPGLGEKLLDTEIALSRLMVAKPFRFENRSSWYPQDLLQSFSTAAPHVLEVLADNILPAWCALKSASLITPARIALQPSPGYSLQLVHSGSIASLLDKVSSLVSFESQFTGQLSNMRTELLEKEVDAMGPPPPGETKAYRPERSELNQVHAEFNNVLKATVYSEIATSNLQDLPDEALHLVTENVSRVINRLSGYFASYQDMTRPVVNLLRVMQVGLSLITEPTGLSKSTAELVSVTPFLGGNLLNWTPGLQNKTFEFIDLMTVSSAIDGVDRLSAEDREAIFSCFHAFYNEWTLKLEADRKEEEARQSLYRFKGSFEDEEEMNQEEFNELFPTFEGEEDEPTSKPSVKRFQVREMSIRVAEAHKKLLVSTSEALSALRTALISVGRKIATELSEKTAVDQDISKKLLPGVLLTLDGQLSSLQADKSSSSYNFYTDANLHEARQLVHLANSIATRFRELQLTDEIGHLQPIADVRSSCDTVLELVHTEPLAKLLPKVEHLHAMVYEWQFGGWASRVHSATELYDRLTASIVRWRRLELSTWSKLFEMEVERCQDDANSWWFVAYHATIAIPMGLLEKGDLAEYATKLVGDLEVYFSSAILGQFSTRLGLLRQFHKHLELLSLDHPTLSVVHTAVGNFISMYHRYQKAVDEGIARGRLPLEKKMKDVLLLASWKDTNINHLRDSARKSHLKLFRIVRKFRDVLSQPLSLLLEKGIPDEEYTLTATTGTMPIAYVDKETVELANNDMLKWLEQFKPLINVGQTVSRMTQVGCVPVYVTEAVEEIEEFITSLTTSMQELRKETPGILTDENKDQVKHLKARKRKLFADVLRQAREMGFEYNLDTTRLAQQDSLPVILASCGSLSAFGPTSINTAEYFFHKFVDMMPKIRATTTNHSDEVTGREVARSIGYLEGMLSVSLNQRRSLSKSKFITDLEETVAELRSVQKSEIKGNLSRPIKRNNSSRTLRWLVEILRYALQLLEVHAKLGGADSSACQAKLQTWLSDLGSLSSQDQVTRKMPTGLSSTRREVLEALISERLQAFENDIKAMMQEFDGASFILGELLNWTQVSFEDKLRIDSMARYLKRYVDKLQGVDLAIKESDRSVMALTAMVTPIVDQYAIVCRTSYTRFLEVHRSTAQLAHCLGKSYTHLASQGFCTPQEKSDETSGNEGKLESGTGLGDGEGAEDISKDIQPDEDLTELAQEPNKEKDGEIEDEKDAVDMADEDMEGEMGSAAGDDEEDEKEGDEGESENEMDEETGDVDDLDATATDEKMWEGDGEEAEKDQQGEKPKGQQQNDEQMAAEAQEQDMSDQDEGDKDETEAAEEEPEDESEDIKPQQDVERQDQNVDESEALELPDDMDLDMGDDQGSGGEDDELDDLDNLSDTDEKAGEEEDTNMPNEDDEPGDETKPADTEGEEPKEAEAEDDDVANDDADPLDEQGMEEQGDEAQEEKDEGEQEEDKGVVEQPSADPVDLDPQDVAPSDVKSGGQDQNKDTMDIDEDFHNNSTRQDEGASGDGSDSQQAQPGGQGKLSKPEDAAQQQNEDDTQHDDSEASRPEPFRKLGDALEKWHRQQKEIQDARPEEEPNEQTIGAATEDEVQPIDDSMAIDEEKQDPSSNVLPDTEETEAEQDADQMDTGDADGAEEAEANMDPDDGRSGVKTRQGAYDGERSPSPPLITEEDVDEGEDDDEQWSEFQNKTQPLSQSLTSHLRLILTPSQSTKLSGSFRTGKRLNIKRIIPYIASSYKRDKIWMRRSVPTKRAYQILLCVDDSKSMGESNSGSLALESLVMVSRSLNMLEAGQIGVDRTDICLLIRNTIDRFRAARLQADRGGEDLWQLALILSDGLTQSATHDSIRRLLREAAEERIMIVFIVMDDATKRKGDSVLQLKEARFVKDVEGNSRVVIERYLDTFPFQYYLIVHHLDDLPNALSGLLRTWFAEVNA
ncbi:unnamed protein product [Parascedosporium putredinis]|uniref:Midasin n=1 Tax=Parascedosporium putredinis TaxID=1442378 RepID=A0A9P1HA05_9PEZI|nr:unnamed protein product [Parascedosporium putredinis]CAI8001534.1 unnamed protein product [Parascedosporium putredinis]